jgi:hypothetical protein
MTYTQNSTSLNKSENYIILYLWIYIISLYIITCRGENQNKLRRDN